MSLLEKSSSFKLLLWWHWHSTR